MPPPSTPSDPIARLARALGTGGESGMARALGRLERAAATARAPMERLNRLLTGNPAGATAFRRAAGDILAAEAATRKLAAANRAHLDLAARRSAVSSGAYARDLRAQQLLARETAKVLDLERRARLEFRYGQLGGRIAYHAGRMMENPAVRGSLHAAQWGGMAAAGLARQGFSGTVEWNRVEMELTLISRELAGAMMPAIKWATKALQKFRHWLERLGPMGQDLLQAGMIAAGGFGAYRMLGAAQVMLGFGGTAAAGAGLAPAAAGVGAAGAGLAPAAAGAGAAGVARFGLRAAGKFALKTLPVVGAAYTAYEGIGGFVGAYDEAIRKKEGSGTAVLKGLGNAVANVVSLGMWSPYGPERKTGPDPSRDRVTQADAGFVEAGSSYERVTTGLAMVDANETEARESMKKSMADAAKTLEELKKMNEAWLSKMGWGVPPR